MTDTDTQAATATGGKVWICPGCGARYSEPTVCEAQHAPLEAQEFDLPPAEQAPAEAPGEAAGTAQEPPAPAPAAEAQDTVETPTGLLEKAQEALQAARDGVDTALAALAQHLGQ